MVLLCKKIDKDKVLCSAPAQPVQGCLANLCNKEILYSKGTCKCITGKMASGRRPGVLRYSENPLAGQDILANRPVNFPQPDSFIFQIVMSQSFTLIYILYGYNRQLQWKSRAMFDYKWLYFVVLFGYMKCRAFSSEM